MNDCIAVFETTFETLRAEQFFRARNVTFHPVLKPRKLGSACRMALKFSMEKLPLAMDAVTDGNLALLGFFRREGEEWVSLNSPAAEEDSHG